MLASAAVDNTVRLWDVARASEQAHAQGHSAVWTVAFSPDGAPWPRGQGQHGAAVGRGDGPRAAPSSGASGLVIERGVQPDGRTLASAAIDNTVRLWDVATGASTTQLQRASGLRSCAWRSVPTAARWPRRPRQHGAAVGRGHGREQAQLRGIRRGQERGVQS